MDVFAKHDMRVIDVERSTGTWIKVGPIRGRRLDGMGYIRAVTIYGTQAGCQAVETQLTTLQWDHGAGDVAQEIPDMEEV
ncbi:hypothetical protein QVD17_15107 [Tagetes erecta]|uniref:Uncharacterized protein n=1 Tax=Tagetes erecta TaxID=13708 RepID=A0AAD8NSB7_TARER|nr:hypothetical protein QVD17_15107 [Tagetes erecta]